jgi:nicotinamidase/pyrazinamidase
MKLNRSKKQSIYYNIPGLEPLFTQEIRKTLIGSKENNMNKALIVIDMQNDFMEGGSLAVPGSKHIIEYINKLRKNYDMVVFTKDFHPEDHCSFKENGGIWPVHCVQKTKGSKVHKDLHPIMNDFIIKKGKNKNFDSYSGFMDDGGTYTGLYALLTDNVIDEIDVVGVATEYCVKFTVLDGLNLGLKVNLLIRGCAAIDNFNEIRAVQEMQKAGATIIYKGSRRN